MWMFSTTHDMLWITHAVFHCVPHNMHPQHVTSSTTPTHNTCSLTCCGCMLWRTQGACCGEHVLWSASSFTDVVIRGPILFLIFLAVKQDDTLVKTVASTTPCHIDVLSSNSLSKELCQTNCNFPQWKLTLLTSNLSLITNFFTVNLLVLCTPQ